MRRMSRGQVEQSRAGGVESSDVGVCQSCGYDLRGLAEARCPECGTAFDFEALRSGSVVWCKTAILYLRAAAIVQVATCSVLTSLVGPLAGLFLILILAIWALVAGYYGDGPFRGYVDCFKRIWPVEEIVDGRWRYFAGMARSLVMIGVLFALFVAICAALRHWFVFRNLVWVAGLLFTMFVLDRYQAGVRCNKAYGVRPKIARSLRRTYFLNIILMAVSTFVFCVFGLLVLRDVYLRYWTPWQI